MNIKGRMRAANKILIALAQVRPGVPWARSELHGARFGIDHVEQVWYVDGFTGLMLYPFGDAAWPGFSGNDAERELVNMLAAHVRDGAPFDLARIEALGPGGDMQLVLEAVTAGGRAE